MTASRRASILRAMARQVALPPSLPPRLVSREVAAAYVSLSASKFDDLVKDGRMPRPREIDRRRLWDVRALDIAVDNLPTAGEPAPDDSWSDVHAA